MRRPPRCVHACVPRASNEGRHEHLSLGRQVLEKRVQQSGVGSRVELEQSGPTSGGGMRGGHTHELLRYKQTSGREVGASCTTRGS